MVRTQIVARGVTDERILDAMRRIPRKCFLSQKTVTDPYGDHPIPIGYGQTISQPYIVAFMTSLLSARKDEIVLEVGTGSGYQTAVLSSLYEKVYTVERIPFLLKRAKVILSELGFNNIEYRMGDGSEGWKEEAPFNGIIVTAAVPSIPEAYKDQLADNGRLVIPVGDYRVYQVLTVLRRVGMKFEARESIGCRFVPLIGKQAF